jgi:hypothetical protein
VKVGTLIRENAASATGMGLKPLQVRSSLFTAEVKEEEEQDNTTGDLGLCTLRIEKAYALRQSAGRCATGSRHWHEYHIV